MAETDRRVQVLANLKCLYPTLDIDVVTLSYHCAFVPKGTGFQAVAIKYDDHGASTSILYGDADAPTRMKAIETLLRKTEEDLCTRLAGNGIRVPLDRNVRIITTQSQELSLGTPAHGYPVSEESEDFEVIATPNASSDDEGLFCEITMVQPSQSGRNEILPAGAPDPLKPEKDWAYWVVAYLEKKQETESFGETKPDSTSPLDPTTLPIPGACDGTKDNWAYWVAAQRAKEKAMIRDEAIKDHKCCGDVAMGTKYPHGSLHRARNPRGCYPPGSNDNWAYWAARNRGIVVENTTSEASPPSIQNSLGHTQQILPSPSYPPGSNDSWAYWASKHMSKRSESIPGIDNSVGLEVQAPSPPPDVNDNWAFWVSKHISEQADSKGSDEKSSAPTVVGSGGKAPLPDAYDDWAFWVFKHMSEEERKKKLAVKQGSSFTGAAGAVKATGQIPGCPLGSGDTWAYWASCKADDKLKS